MVTRNKTHKTGEKEEKKGRVKVGKLQINKETVKDLSSKEAKNVKGGGGATAICRPTGGNDHA